MACLLWTALFVGVLAIGYAWANSRWYMVHKRGVIIVTGASSGIGKDAALALAWRGFHVLAGVRSDASALRLCAEAGALCEGELARLQPVTLDVLREEDIRDVLATGAAMQMKDSRLQLVGIINNAGVSKDLPWEFIDKAAIDFTIDTNFKGVALLTAHAIPSLRRSHGRVITVGSAAGRVPQAGMGLYSASKHAVEALTDTLRREMIQFGVSVSLVDPGCIQAEIFNKSLLQNDPSRKLADTFPLERVDLYKNHFVKRDAELSMCEKTAKNPAVTSTPDIVHAMTSPYPRARYFPGGYMGAPIYCIVWLFWIVPDRVMDLLVTLPADKVYAAFMPFSR